jgi:hypothetical protein
VEELDTMLLTQQQLQEEIATATVAPEAELARGSEAT